MILPSILMAAGLSGPAVIATDAAIPFALGSLETLTFLAAAALTPRLILLALVIGAACLPGGFVGRRFALRMDDGVKTAIPDRAGTPGGLLLVWEAMR